MPFNLGPWWHSYEKRPTSTRPDHDPRALLFGLVETEIGSYDPIATTLAVNVRKFPPFC